ncbi:G1 family glutamic endopeptidase [Streptomyces sp. NPDC021093]|uniref:G1 family glutamic endopeptidase n=1 Tax=Streptomyces sp. NPDC021093 TaxID=3365112 RepID=UPI0037951314
MGCSRAVRAAGGDRINPALVVTSWARTPRGVPSGVLLRAGDRQARPGGPGAYRVDHVGMRTRRRTLAVGALSVCGLLAAGSASAAKDPCLHPVGNWAGATLPGDHTSVGARWRVPAVDCAESGEEAQTDNWIGSGTGRSWQDPLNQIGTSALCQDGTAHYLAWWEQYPAAPYNFTDTLRPGDLMSAAISREAGSQDYLLKLTNRTRKWSRKVSLAGPPTSTQVQVITELHTPAAVTSTARYDAVEVDGRPLLSYRDTLKVTSRRTGGVCVDTSTPGPTTLVTAVRKS